MCTLDKQTFDSVTCWFKELSGENQKQTREEERVKHEGGGEEEERGRWGRSRGGAGEEQRAPHMLSHVAL